MKDDDGAEKKDDENTKPFLEEIIYPDIEPGIISRAMIENSYLEEGHHGEALRLHQLEPVVLENIKTMRLEFKNILRIDHLWILPNLTKLCLNCNKIEVIEHLEMLTALKELNLSFNYIEKIANLETLVNLETLSLFSNRITKIENLEMLEKLVILSIGNNLIESVEGIDSFRFLDNLKVLNLEGNPIATKPDFSLSQYCIAILPKLNYYEYVFIKDEVREEAKERYYREVREIEDKQEKDIQARELQAREKAEAERLSSSFVEHLDGHQLYESLWKGDEDGRVLMLVGSQAHELAEEYDKDMFELTQEIYKLGLDSFGERDEEVRDFMANLKDGQAELQVMGQKVIEGFLAYKENVFEEARITLRQLESNMLEGEDEDSPENVKLSETMEKINFHFDETMNTMWQTLMEQELHLHEAVEESTTNFHRKMTELMSKFVEQAQSYFVQLREISVHFSENLSEIVSRYIATKLAMQDFDDVPQELHVCMDDRDAILNLIAGMKDTHTLRIDEREDRMATRSKEFIDDMIEKLNNEEIERHRAKILEINSFIEMMTDALAALPHEIREQLIAEEYF
ncbi:dynein regulatory complex subunit 3 [Scaptodrosophila lebanonensis]|uniref:Dynein axonemal assembly factor 1 homolog n=1 Tax=Drosophila lebanonensis TaxID=7225 RepID=A0A6J2TNY5_DROLE|nr:dynein regulatory complex subunit 3 [Scaptodrosophila lebanonensis]